jgi:3-hydroxyisobutyrate dehydrogenase
MLGCDPEIISNVMNVSTAKCWSNDVNIPHPKVATTKERKSPATRNYQGGFSTSLLLKDLSLALDTAKASHRHNNDHDHHNHSSTTDVLPMTTLSRTLYRTLIEENEGWDQKDFGIMFQYLLDKHRERHE